MKAFFTILVLISFMGCAELSTSTHSTRTISSIQNDTQSSNLEILDWHIVTTKLRGLNYVYTPFEMNNSMATLYTGGAGVNPGNGVLKLTTTLSDNNSMSEKFVIRKGPDLKNYNYFRAPRVARNGDEVWMVVEIAGCYSGCDSKDHPKSLGVYNSSDAGKTWKFLDYLMVDGSRFVANWYGHTGLIYNAKGDSEINLSDLTKNKFITIGENKNIFVSADGVHYRSIPMNHPFPKDRLVFASIAKTPYGFHMMTCANWSDKYYTTTVRHLFSKDLVNWIPLESTSSLKNPDFYKGIHLSYDEKSDRLWAISPCGTSDACSIGAWLTPKDYLAPQTSKQSDLIPVGEFVSYNGDTAMILDRTSANSTNSKITYKIRYSSGTIDSGFTKDMFQFPLANYDRQGCEKNIESPLCVGDAIYINGNLASLMGIHYGDSNGVKYAVKFSNGTVDTGYYRSMIALP